jgi:hypothetical protein
MDESRFAERMAHIRVRFANKLIGQIQATSEFIDVLAEGVSGSVNAVADVYRQIHDICGIGPTIGFKATGAVARTLSDILIVPFRAKRGLTGAELAKLKGGLNSLRVALHTESDQTAEAGS